MCVCCVFHWSGRRNQGRNIPETGSPATPWTPSGNTEGRRQDASKPAFSLKKFFKQKWPTWRIFPLNCAGGSLSAGVGKNNTVGGRRTHGGHFCSGLTRNCTRLEGKQRKSHLGGGRRGDGSRRQGPLRRREQIYDLTTAHTKTIAIISKY